MSFKEEHRRTRNIIQSFEAQSLKRRNWDFKLADTLTSFFGSFAFVLLNLLFMIAAWFILWPGDYVLLASILTVEAIFLMIIILMSQIRQNQTSTLRSELQLQVSLITEKELTKVLKLMRMILRKQGVEIKNDLELEQMIDEMDASYIERQLEQEILPKKETFTEKLVEPFKKIKEKGPNEDNTLIV